MRKIYLSLLIAFFAISVNAQAPKTIEKPENVSTINRNIFDYVPASPVIARPASQQRIYAKQTYPPVLVGTTLNDHQSNAAVYRRIKTFSGNEISVVWMTSSDGPLTSYGGRGTGYNHFAAGAWGAVGSSRIEPYRAGYPCLDFSSVMNKEVVFSHKIDTSGKSGGLLFTNNLGIGGSIWTSQVVLDTPSITTHPSALWPRIAISGNYIHVIASYTPPTGSGPQTDTVIMNGVRSPTVYSRYNISTSTWEVKNSTLPGYNSTRWYDGNADSYSIDANGTNVAILMGGLSNDISFWKSTDNGHTWTNKIIDSFPVPAYKYDNTDFDTTYVSDGAMNVMMDGTGKAHCFWGRGRVLHNSGTQANSISYFPSQNAVDYWYEGRPDSIKGQIGYSPDVNGDGLYDPGTIDAGSRYGNLSAVTMPYATVDGSGNIFLIYSGLTEGDQNGQKECYRDVYCVYSTNNGVTWSTPRDLTAQFGLQSEEMFASTPQILGSKLQMTYMQSDQVGFYSSSNTTGNPNKTGTFNIMYAEIPLADIIQNSVGINTVTANDLFTINQNFPNPFRGSTTIPVNLKTNSDVNISVMNVVGQTVFVQKFEKAQPGINNFSMDLSNLKAGVYFYTVEVQGYKSSSRMVIE